MALTRQDPFRDLAVLQDRMSRLFGDSYGAREEGVVARAGWVKRPVPGGKTAIRWFDRGEHQRLRLFWRFCQLESIR